MARYLVKTEECPNVESATVVDKLISKITVCVLQFARSVYLCLIWLFPIVCELLVLPHKFKTGCSSSDGPVKD